MISEETRAYYDLKKCNDVRESAKRIRRQFTLVVLVLFHSIFMLGYVPTESMEPTLETGSLILGLRIFDELETGDIIIFRRDGSYPDIRLILVFPCFSQTRGWSQEDIEIYDDIKQKADKVVYTSQEYTRGCMHKRNRHLVDNSSACISYLTENKGGTFYTVNYAKSKGVEVINIAE